MGTRKTKASKASKTTADTMEETTLAAVLRDAAC